MTKLSVNVNKIALLRNSRGRDFPNVIEFAKKFINLGVHGITVHPRQDERHITVKDAYQLAEFLQDYPDVEYNIEGFPSKDFMKIIADTKPDQCTLVPDGINQVTSDHGWDMHKHQKTISDLAKEIGAYGVRSAVFLDPEIEQVKLVAQTGVDRIELYTEEFATNYGTGNQLAILEKYRQATILAQQLGLGVNAGHDLDSHNLATFLQIENILEVSIGHVLTIECIEQGMPIVIKKYVDICEK
ncbi:MAG: pyridoxine 5'-phosphate synthase [Alcanivoracaceae bacterium]|nr:pyridoxine 5'-phosphate synthase [Alcanivoracaceae bacterium]